MFKHFLVSPRDLHHFEPQCVCLFMPLFVHKADLDRNEESSYLAATNYMYTHPKINEFMPQFPLQILNQFGVHVVLSCCQRVYIATFILVLKNKSLVFQLFLHENERAVQVPSVFFEVSIPAKIVKMVRSFMDSAFNVFSYIHRSKFEQLPFFESNFLTQFDVDHHGPNQLSTAFAITMHVCLLIES